MAEDSRTATRSQYEDAHQLSDPEIVALVRLEIDHAMGYDDEVLGDLRARANDFYHGNTQSSSIPSAPAGRSNIVSMDVHDTVNSLLAETLPMIQQSQVVFEAENREDEQAAQLESDYISAELEKNGFSEIAYSAAHSAYNQGNGWIKVEIAEDSKVTRETLPYEITDPIEYDLVSSPRVPGEQVHVQLNPGATEIMRITPTQRLAIDCVAPENVIFSPARNQYETEDLQFIAERKLFSVTELVEDYGMSSEDASSIPDHHDDYWPGIIARREKYYGESDAHNSGFQQQTRLKECFCCYMDIALNTGDPAEKYYLMIGGEHLIKMYPVPFQPWVTGSPIPMPHRIQGRGMYEVQKDVQEAKTSLLRTLIDNAMVANGSRTAYNENTVNVKHLTNGRVNGVVAVNGLPGEHIFQLQAGDLTPHMTAVLQYLDEVRSSRGGATVDMNDAEMQTAKSSAEAAYGVKVSKEKMAGFYARNLVQSLLKGVYLKAHETMRYYIAGPRSAKVRGNWVQTDPSKWPEREWCKVITGLTEVERRQRTQGLNMLTGMLQQMNMQGGSGIITDVSKVYNSMANWIKAANLGAPEEYLLDPTSEESIQSQRMQAERAQQQQNMGMQMVQLKQAMEEMRLELDKYKHDSELKFKYWKEGVEATENTEDNQTQLKIASINKESNENRAAAGDS